MLTQKQPQRVAGVGLALSETNPKKGQFTVKLLFDEKEIEHKDISIFEPIYFSVQGISRTYELVVNKIGKESVVGYISIPRVYK